MGVRVGSGERIGRDSVSASTAPVADAAQLNVVARAGRADGQRPWIKAALPFAVVPRAGVLAREPAVHVKPRGSDAGAAATPEGAWVIDELAIGPDRPDGIFAPKEKKHTTAWQVTIDMVRGAVVGQTVTAAVANLKMLIGEVQKLPGKNRAKSLQQAPKGRYDTAVEGANTHSASTGDTVAQVRGLVLALLRLRAIMPLSAIDAGAYAPGDGEAGAAATLRDIDRDGFGPGRPKSAGKAAIDKLLDESAVGLLEKGARPALAGLTGGPMTHPDANKMTKDIRAQHLRSIRLAYPDAYELLRPRETNAPVFPHKRKPQELKRAETSAQAHLDAKGNVERIAVSGRPPTGLASGQGSHLTAFGLHRAVLDALVKDKPPDAAIAAVTADINKQIASIDPARRREMPEWQMQAGGPTTDGFNEAVKAADAAKAYAAKTNTDKLSQLEELCAAWLRVKNAAPLSAVKLGVAAGAAEGTVIAALKQPGNIDASLRFATGWGLLDFGALGSLIGASRPNDVQPAAPGRTQNAAAVDNTPVSAPATKRPRRDSKPPERLTVPDKQKRIPLEQVRGLEAKEEFPGIGPDRAKDAADVIRGYLEELDRGFNNVAKTLELRTLAGLYFLLTRQIGEAPEIVKAVARQLGLTTDEHDWKDAKAMAAQQRQPERQKDEAEHTGGGMKRALGT